MFNHDHNYKKTVSPIVVGYDDAIHVYQHHCKLTGNVTMFSWWKRKPQNKPQPSSLIWAAANGYIDYLKYLLFSGIDLSIYGSRAIEAATMRGQKKMVKYLLKHGVKPTEKAIAHAGKRMYPEILEILKK